MTQRPIEVCLIMHSTRSDNLGVGALTVSEIEILREISKEMNRPINITVMDWKDPRTPYVEGPDITIKDLDGKTMVNPMGFFRQALKSDIMIDIGGGDSFADIYGAKRLNRMFLLKYLTHFARTPLVVAPQTIGPFTQPSSLRRAKRSLNWSKLVATRDAMSTKAAREMGVTAPIVEASDVALRLPYTPPAPRKTDEPIKVGINVSGLLMGGGYTGKNEFGLTMDYPALIRQLVTYFQSHADGCEVHFVPHVIIQNALNAAEDDYRASEALHKEFPGSKLAPAFASPSEAKSYIAGLDFFMGARMHACIAAFSSGVPVVPMAYSRKFAGLFGTIGYDKTVDCTSQTAEHIAEQITQGYANRTALKAEADTALENGLRKLDLYKQGLRALCEKV